MDRAAWDDRYREKELLWTAEPNRLLVEITKDWAAGTAYDLAGGEGRNAVWLAEHGWKVTVVDWSGVAIEKGRALAEARRTDVEFVEADLLEWAPDRAVDLVTVLYLHLPLAERQRVWEKSTAALAPGGRLVMIGHDASNLEEGHGGPQDPEVLYTPAEVVEVIGDRVRIERADVVDRSVETDDGVVTARDGVVVAVAPS
jgi:SAM-dependent methyltransferase